MMVLKAGSLKRLRVANYYVTPSTQDQPLELASTGNDDFRAC